MLGNLVNMPPIVKDLLPALPVKKDTPPSPSGPSAPPNQGSGSSSETGSGSEQTEPRPDKTPPNGTNAPKEANEPVSVTGQLQVHHGEIETETSEGALEIEAWARRAALEVQKNEQFASMLMRIAKPKAAEQLALLSTDKNGSTDFSSVSAAYLEYQGDGPGAAGERED